MKKLFISLIISVFAASSLFAANAAGVQYYKCVFEDDFNRPAGEAWASWWDPLKSYTQDHAGSVYFSGKNLQMSANSRVPLVPIAGISDAGVNFREGVLEFDLLWNLTGHSLRIDLGFIREPLTYTNLSIAQDKISVSNNASQTVNLTTGKAGVSSYSLTEDNVYRIKIFISRNTSSEVCEYKAYIAKLTDGVPGQFFMAANGSAASNLYGYSGGGLIRFVAPAGITQAVIIDNVKIFAPSATEKEFAQKSPVAIQTQTYTQIADVAAAATARVCRNEYENADANSSKNVFIIIAAYKNDNLSDIKIKSYSLLPGELADLEVAAPYPSESERLSAFVWDGTNAAPLGDAASEQTKSFETAEDIYAYAREAAKNRQRRIIYNNDGNDTYKTYDNYPGPIDLDTITEEMTHENFLSKRSVGVENTQIDTIFYCTGVFNEYHHRTSGEHETRTKDWSYTLADNGMDSLETIIDFGQENGKEVFWSMRMNDTHDSGYTEDQLGEWKRANMNLLMGRKSEQSSLPYGGSRWSAINYGEAGARQKVLNILTDVCERYDIDGVELDFFRHPVFFKEVMLGNEIQQTSIDKMNDLMRQIRQMTQRVGMERRKPLLISVRVPDSKEYCRAIGLDLETWLSEGLIDMVAGGGYFRLQPWARSVELCSAYGVPFYAGLCTDYLESPTTNLELWKKEAAQAFSEGVSGIHIFNYFSPKGAVFKTVGSPDTTGPVDPSHTPVMVGDSNSMGRWLKNGENYLINY